MARPPLPLGTWGTITRKELPTGTWEARARYRDWDGNTRQVRATGPTGASAERTLTERLRDRSRAGTGDELTRDSTISQLADYWIAHIERKGEVTEQTIETYQGTIRRHIIPGLSGVRLHEATTGRLDKFLGALDGSRPKSCRVVLSQMFALAARHGATNGNPVRDTETRATPRKEVRILANEQIAQLRENVTTYTGGNRMGPTRGTDLLDLVDVMLGTGVRIGELLALRWEDVSLDRASTVTVCGTAVSVNGSGFVRQSWPKSKAGFRTLILPPFAERAVRRQLERGAPSVDGLAFPSARGTIRNPNNVRRQLRVARGDGFDWVTPHTFRKTAATLIEAAYGVDAARAVMGHSSSRVTEAHYVRRAAEAPNVSSVFAGIG